MASPFTKHKLKNFLILFFLKFFPKKEHKFDPLHPKILIVSTTALGDTLWGTPAINSIKKKYPESSLSALCSPIGLEVLKKNPHIDKLFLIKEPLWLIFFNLYRKLKKEKFQAILIFHSSQRLILPLCYLLNPKFLVATANINKGLDILLSHPIEKKEMHEIERRLEIIKKINVDEKNYKMFYLFDEKKEFLNPLNIIAPLIIFHPGAKDSFRCYPPSSYIELGKKLFNFYQSTIVITGTKREERLVKRISEKIPKSIALYDQGLEELATLFQRSDLIIIGDTGPLHLALALEKKVIALFVPTSLKKFGPYHCKNAYVIQKDRPCAFCKERACKDPFCFDQITQEELFSTCQALLK